MTDSRTIEELIEKAKQFNPEALRKLGIALFTGDGIQQSVNDAIRCLRAAVWEGDVQATDALSAAMFSANTKYDDHNAIMYTKMGADAGIVMCICKLAQCYEGGKDIIPQNPVLAFQYFLQAANKNDQFSQDKVAGCYYLGKGTAVDYEQAFAWYEKLAQKGDIKAQYNLGVIAEQNMYDDNLAGYWYNEAAQRGDSESQRALQRFTYGSFTNKWKKKS